MSKTRGIENRVIALSLIDAHPRNYNKHSAAQLADLAASLDQFGQVRSIVVQRKGKRFTAVAGHGIAEAARSLGWKEIRADVIPSGWSQTRVLAYLAADNELARRGDPDQDQLAAIVQEVLNAEGETLARLAAGEQSALDALLVRANPKEETADVGELVDKAAELQKKWKVQRGDVWQIGKHRLMCGDSTSAEDVATLMGGEKADSLITDPPYGVDYSSKNEFLNKADKGNRVQSPIENDNIEDYRTFFNAFLAIVPFADYNTIYVFSNDPHLHDVRLSFEDCGFVFTTYIAWVKNNHVLGRKDYNGKHEHIAYGWRGKHKFYGGFATSVLEIDKPMRSELHPTTKPTELISKLVGDGSPNGGIVYDAFTGSGTTLVACEQTGRLGRGMEIEPKYCAVTLERLSLLGLTPQRIENVGDIGHRKDGKKQGKTAAKIAANSEKGRPTRQKSELARQSRSA